MRDVAYSMFHGVGSPKEISFTESLPRLGLKVLQSQPTGGGHSTASGLPWGGLQAMWGAKA